MYETVEHAAGAERRQPGAEPTSRTLVLVPGQGLRRRHQDELWAIDVRRVAGWMRRGVVLLATTTIVFGLLGMGYAILSKPRFTAETAILIDPSNLQVVPDDIYAQSQQRDSQLLEVESMLGVLTSGNTLSRVVADLHLAEDPEFVKPAAAFDPGMPFGANAAAGPARPPEVVALEALASRVKAKRDDGSFIVNLSLWTGDAQKSVLIVNALVSAFQEELARGEAEGAGRSAGALSDRLTALKADVETAEQAVEAFKRSHNLQSTNGELINAQSMTQLNAQVIEAQQRLIAARSRYDELARAGQSGASTAALQSATLTALRTQYAVLKQQYDAAVATFGARHPKLRDLAPQMSALENQIAAEIGRTIAAGKADLDAAQADLNALTARTAAVRSAVATDNDAQVQLRELQRAADSSATIYQAYLSRAGQVAQREQIDTTNVRVISPAVQPQRSWPPSPLLACLAGLVAGLAAGALLAAAAGLLRDYRSLGATAKA